MALDLIRIFKEKKNMVSVGLESCGLGPEEAVAVVKMIHACSSLTSVDVGSNKIGKESALDLIRIFTRTRLAW